ncbi:MAG: hypothetical protein NC517_04875 [Firmicutes bacterium]|nr:hypothetical protein [Bacillota bacterium]
MEEAEIISFEISERADAEEGYFVRIHAVNNGFLSAEFSCKSIAFRALKYRRMSQ